MVTAPPRHVEDGTQGVSPIDVRGRCRRRSRAGGTPDRLRVLPGQQAPEASSSAVTVVVVRPSSVSIPAPARALAPSKTSIS